VSEETGEGCDSGKCEPPATILLAMEPSDTVRKYLMLTTLSSTENVVYRVQQKVDKQKQQLRGLSP
jgi:hypothetical protein